MDCKVSDWLTLYFASDKKDSCVLPAWATKRRNWYKYDDAILVDCTISA